MNVFLRGPDLDGRIGYRVFPSDPDAAGYFSPADHGPGYVIVDRPTFEASGRPARCETYRYVSGETPVTATDCLLLAGSIVVVGTSAQEGDGDPRRAEQAALLARAGAEHLDRLAAQIR
jgi:hypothetical protein